MPLVVPIVVIAPISISVVTPGAGAAPTVRVVIGSSPVICPVVVIVTPTSIVVAPVIIVPPTIVIDIRVGVDKPKTSIVVVSVVVVHGAPYIIASVPIFVGRLRKGKSVFEHVVALDNDVDLH